LFFDTLKQIHGLPIPKLRLPHPSLPAAPVSEVAAAQRKKKNCSPYSDSFDLHCAADSADDLWKLQPFLIIVNRSHPKDKKLFLQILIPLRSMERWVQGARASGAPYASFFEGVRSFDIPSCQNFLSPATGSF